MNESRHVVSRQTSVCRPPTKLVDRSYSAYKNDVACSSQIPPTKLVDRSYSVYKKAVACSSQIPPTKLVDRSYPAYKAAASSAVSVVPSTRFGGIPNGVRQTFCRPDMNDPPTALVGFGSGVCPALFVG